MTEIEIDLYEVGEVNQKVDFRDRVMRIRKSDLLFAAF